jgi:phosphatidylserine decarboxylase
MPLTLYGLRVWLPILLGMIVLSGLFAWLGWWWMMWVVVAVGLALLSFFRDPIRRIRSDHEDGVMLSPADGTISAVFDAESHPAIPNDGPAKVIRIFLSVLNVHVNRSPYDGEVIALKHTPGKFLNAQTEESANVNECNLITMKVQVGGREEIIGIRQVAGMLARAIVCPLKPGDHLKRGQKFGMIKFGSTTELILPRPQDVEVFVKKGDKVKGGVTVLARLNPVANAVERR